MPNYISAAACMVCILYCERIRMLRRLWGGSAPASAVRAGPGVQSVQGALISTVWLLSTDML